MAVTLVQAIPGKSARDRNTGEESLTDLYRVHTNNALDSKPDIELAAGIPDYGDSHPDRPGLFVVNRVFQQSQVTGRLWTVSVEYTSNQGAINFNPLTQPTVFRVVTQAEDRPLRTDKNDELYANSAGDLIVGATRRKSFWVVTAVKNIATVPGWLLSIQDTINEAAFPLKLNVGSFTVPAKTMRVDGIDFDDTPRERNGIKYYPFTIVAHFRKNGWQRKEVDRGFRELGSDPSERIKITNSDGTDITEPALLDGAGTVITDPEPSDAVILTFDVEEELDFTTIPHFA